MSTRSCRSGSIRSGQSGSRARAPTYHRKSSTFKSYRPPQGQRRGGLAIRGSRGTESMLFTDQQMADDLLATVPKLHAAIMMDAQSSPLWRRKGCKGGIAAYELVPSSDRSDDMDLAYASLAKTEIKCHLNEVLNVLISHESSDYQSTMAALCGDKFRDGRVVFQQRCHFSDESRKTLSGSNPEGVEGQKVLITVNRATLQPMLHMKFQSKKHRQPQKLCFASFTHQYASKDRAVHVMKTLPKHVHDELVPRSERTALRNHLDHLAVGFDVQSKPAPAGSSSPTTTIVAHGYAAVTPPEAFGAYSPDPLSRIAAPNKSQVARRRAAAMNPEAKHVLDLLTRSLREFERVIRRRRFGFQSFVYFHTASVGARELKSCSICQKRFSLLRRDFFCQLCGHMVCRDCSQLYEVEAHIGEVRTNRICVECVVRVDACKFEDENLIAALGPTVVSDDRWFSDSETESLDDDLETASLAYSSPNEMLHDQLASGDPVTRSQALEQLGRLVSPTASGSMQSRPKRRRKHKTKTIKEEPPRDLSEKVRWDIEHHLKQSLRVAEKHTRPEDCEVAGSERDYAFEFDGSRTRDPNHPLPPTPEQDKESKRLQYINNSGVLDPTFDRSALNLLAQVAAKQLNCPVGYVSMVGEKTFHAVGTFPQRPPEMNVAPRDENMCAHTVYADKPLVVKNPQRDMRFAQMPIIKDAGVKFYAGFPIRAPDGAIVASLCTSDFKPHDNISTKEYATMETLAKLAGQLVAPRQLPAAAY
ncbi:hypothetical protein PF005_g13434 [Phytophthora fragariae]|nr:hypothetical protein PF003_g12877 [Phytophthora fragariae]KAE8935314.1 hypothetical protein PF009_g14743 [Phytophthora fragariae]KAE9006103.1 hypothetical protein PF011_g11752 [Phytophthora fragariae]KAE9105087.1 hypothetical protein PF010_g13150 [Phytophthora fragariae]KAE9105109.1 hypothetical protein PF007_g13819 [Phytophthora fragariae]